LLGGEFDLYEDDRLVATVDGKHSEAEILYGKLILSCWGEGWSRSWRVDRCEFTAARARLRCAKQMGTTVCTLDLHRGAARKGIAESRHEFTATLRRLIENNLSGLKVGRAIAARDDPHQLSVVHSRLIIHERGRLIAGIGIGEREPQAHIDATLGAGLIWLDALRLKGRGANRLMIFAPRGRTSVIAARMVAVAPAGAALSLYEVDEAERKIEPLAAFDQGDLMDNLRKAGIRPVWPGERSASRASALADSVIQLAPDLIDTRWQNGWTVFSIRGLEFARASVARNMIRFGLDQQKTTLNEGNRSKLEALAAEIAATRAPESQQRNADLFRSYSERWLESIIRRRIVAVDPTLDPRYVYTQVPAYRGEQRSFIDLLTVTRSGRLAVIELKVSEDAEFPFQGLDYWLRVEWHRRRGDFQRRGYFAGLQLADAPPLLYLVAPLFRFHASTRLIAGSITERVPVYRIGINDDWRRGVRVLLSERLNGIE